MHPVERLPFSPVDAVFAIAVIATIVAFFHITRGSFFWADDWPMALRGRTLGDFLEPYNGHLSIVPIAIWRASYQVFGFGTYVPLRLVGILSLVSGSVAIFVVFRSRMGPFVAGVAATSILWYRGTSLEAVAFNHHLVLTAGVLCAGALTRRGRAADWTVAALLTFALCSAGGGVAVAAACVVHSLCTRAGRDRWLAVLVPSAAWVVWWLAYSRHATELPALIRPTNRQIVEAVSHGIRASFDGLAFGSRAGGIVLAILFVAYLVWRLRQGLRASANALAWSAALVTWWTGLAYNRGLLMDPKTFRYEMFGSVIVLLALLPPAPISRLREWRSPLAAPALAVFVALLAFANHGPTTDIANTQRHFASFAKQEMIVANQGRTAVPDAHMYGLALGYRTAHEYRQAVGYYGIPAGTDPRSPDAALVSLGRIRPGLRESGASCAHPNDVATVAPNAIVLVQPGRSAVEVTLRRFGTEEVGIGTVPPGSAATIRLAGLDSTRPWHVTARGACITKG